MMYRIEDGRNYLAQWDTGQRLIIDDPAITEVHFAKSRELAAPMKVETGNGLRVARIPDVCLQQPRDLVAFFVVTGSDGQSSTVRIATIKVLRRQKPDDYVETEDEVLRWTSLASTIGTLTDLQTENKASLVAAINEIWTNVGNLTGGSGNVSSSQIPNIVVLDRTDYEAMETHSDSTVYLVRG